MGYDYKEAIKNDIRAYIEENDINWDVDSREEVEQQLNDDLWANDSVTGNGSGYYDDESYDHIQGDINAMDYVRDLVSEFGIDSKTVAEKFLEEDYSYWDVSIRCYLLGECINTVMDEIESERV